MDDPTFKVAVSGYALNRKIPPGDPFWKDFNGSFQNKTLSCLELADSVYTGHPFTTWHLNHWRTSANYDQGQHLALDFDTEDNRSSLPILRQEHFIAKHAAFLYTTPSHTPQAPKARVVFLLDTPIMQAKNYVLAVSALLWLNGTADRQCKDPVRFFYGSRDCDVIYLENVLPLATIKHIIGQYLETGQTTRRAMQRPDWRPPVDQQEVAEALRAIPPWGIDYDQWLACLMGIHAEFGDAGLPLACAWADGGPNEVERKWKSFKPSGNGQGSVSIATVFALAMQHGWRKQTPEA